MEHRCHQRSPLSQSVTVRGHDGLNLHGNTRDISADGMFIRLASHAVPISTVIEIEISDYGCLHGWVVHARDEGIGVMFRSLGDKERKLLGRLLL